MKQTGKMSFFSDMAEHQASAREFFCADLLDSFERNLGIKEVLISYFDTKGNFLSWNYRNRLFLDGPDHPYHDFCAKDMLRYTIYKEAVQDHLDYFNMVPRVYLSTGVIGTGAYDFSPYVKFIEEQFHAHYSVTLAFGINAYIQVTVFKSLEEGNFTEEELTLLSEVYVYVASSYRTFKKFEQAKIISEIQDQIIASGEKAYLVTDDFMHIMDYNKKAQNNLADILGPNMTEQVSSKTPCVWLPFLLGGEEEAITSGGVKTRVVGDYVFRIHEFNQTYSNGIVDRYFWITITEKAKQQENAASRVEQILTKSEQRVAELLYTGKTYRQIAEELTISYHTVKKHVENIYARCGVCSRFQLVKWMDGEI